MFSKGGFFTPRLCAKKWNSCSAAYEEHLHRIFDHKLTNSTPKLQKLVFLVLNGLPRELIIPPFCDTNQSREKRVGC